jgi:hypothetical protein
MLVDKYGRVAGTVHLATLADMYAECDDEELRAHYREVAAANGGDLGEAPEPEPEVEAEPEAEPEPEPEAEPEDSGDDAPPRSGAGSGRDAWATYAESQGVEVTDDMTRDEIIEAVEEHEE